MNCIDKSFRILMIIIYISYKMIQGDLEIIQLCIYNNNNYNFMKVYY